MQMRLWRKGILRHPSQAAPLAAADRAADTGDAIDSDICPMSFSKYQIQELQQYGSPADDSEVSESEMHESQQDYSPADDLDKYWRYLYILRVQSLQPIRGLGVFMDLYSPTSLMRLYDSRRLGDA